MHVLRKLISRTSTRTFGLDLPETSLDFTETRGISARLSFCDVTIIKGHSMKAMVELEY